MVSFSFVSVEFLIGIRHEWGGWRLSLYYKNNKLQRTVICIFRINGDGLVFSVMSYGQ